MPFPDRPLSWTSDPYSPFLTGYFIQIQHVKKIKYLVTTWSFSWFIQQLVFWISAMPSAIVEDGNTEIQYDKSLYTGSSRFHSEDWEIKTSTMQMPRYHTIRSTLLGVRWGRDRLEFRKVIEDPIFELSPRISRTAPALLFNSHFSSATDLAIPLSLAITNGCRGSPGQHRPWERLHGDISSIKDTLQVVCLALGPSLPYSAWCSRDYPVSW